MSLFDLQGHVIVVTGALGQLGTQYCQALAAHGAKVAGLDLAGSFQAWVATSGFYVRNAKSPSVNDLVKFLRTL